MRKIFKITLNIFIIIILIIIYARFIGTTGLITKEYSIIDKDIPNDFDGLKIVHFSDIHYNRAINIDKINKVVKEINMINPDIVVFTGDLIDQDAIINKNDFKNLINSLNKIKSKYGKYAILGNHDYKKDKENVIKVFNESNFMYLDNSFDIISSINNEKILISGINTVTYKKHDIEKALNINDKNIKYKIMLVHEPDITDEIIKKDKINLILGGHSHNGQIRLPFIGALYTPPHAKKYYDEYYNINDTNLYISSGIGVSTINYRLFNRPSINFYRINKD